MRFLIRIILMIIGFPLLIIPTMWATYKGLNELPWGFNKIWGNAEDGWNGNGTQRRHWNLDGTVSLNKGVYGWWPDYLGQQGIIWADLSFIVEWWYSYKWCAIRNAVWNTRNIPYLSTSVDVKDIISYQLLGNASNATPTSKFDLWYDFEFNNREGTFKAKYRHKRIYKNHFLHLRWGWKVYPDLFGKKTTPAFKDRSVYVFQVKLIKVELK
jgi:hypothetical protein